MHIKKQVTYFSDDLDDAMASVNSDGTVDVYGIDNTEWKIEDLKRLAVFLQHVYSESTPLFGEDDIFTISVSKPDNPWPTGDTMIG